VALLETRHWRTMLHGPCTDEVPVFAGAAPSGMPYVYHIGYVTHMEKKQNLVFLLEYLKEAD